MYLKVLLIDVHYKFSSTGKIVYDLYTGLRDNGYDASVCYGRGPLSTDPEVYKFSGDYEVYAHALLTRVTGLTGVYSPLATRKLIKLIEEINPDIVHIHELHAYFVNLAPVMNYLKEKNIKTVWTFHCEFMYTGKCGYSYECEKWKSECKQCPQVREYPSSLFLDFTNKMFHEKKRLFQGFTNLKIVTPSQWLADRVKQSFLSDKSISVIHNGIETATTFYPRPFEHLKEKHQITDEKVILAVAPNLMEPRKGGRHVLELAKQFKGERIKFILIGVDDLNETFDDNIIAMGRTKNQDQLAEYYSMADLFVICSKKENFPTTCLEALSCGTPVCGFDEGGTKETAPNGYGVFVEYADIDQLSKEIRSILYTEPGKIKSSEECVAFARENYDKSVMVKNYLSLYNE